MTKYKYIDTHAHLNMADFDEDRETIIKECQSQGIVVINVGVDAQSSQAVVELAERSGEGIYAIVGLHPNNVAGETFDPDFYADLCQSKKVIGIGECGLDLFRSDPKTKEAQIGSFIEQIKLANQQKLPLMIHVRAMEGNRDSSSASGKNIYDEVYDILKKHATR